MNAAAERRPIRRLDPATIERIAAGEVVERPASVVKELVENAIDAGARSIVVRIERGGLDRIVVADDGHGIPPDELELALERHATSKLSPTGPLDRIATLGFRGEALAAIATVSRFRLVSRIDGREAAVGIARPGGGASAPLEEGRTVGTTVEVDDLFYNTPARRKFLHTPAVEQLEVLRAIEHLYLAQPSVAVRLLAEGRELAAFPASSDLGEAAMHVLGPEFREQSFPLAAELAGFGRLTGALGRPNLAAGNGRRLFLAVNGRTVESRPIAQAVRVAYQEYIPRIRFPVGVVHLAVPLDRVDVNVHPTKREVRFARESELAEAIRVAVRTALLGSPELARLPDRASDPRPPGGPPIGRARGAFAGGDVPPAPAPGAPRLPPSNAVAQRRLGDAPPLPSLVARRGRPALSLLGTLDRLYWVGVREGGFVLLDQHAASERLLYEALLADGHLARQTLVEPVTLVLTAGQRAALEAHAPRVRDAGFDIDPFGGDRVRVRAVPSYRGHRAHPEGLRDLLNELSGGGRPTLPDGLTQRVAASIACHAAIRAGDVVAPEEMARVLDALYERAPAVYSCPHGRPIIFDLPRAQIDRWFLRSGVGP